MPVQEPGMNLGGQRVLITGGASGIGLSLARALQMQGNEVVVCGRDADKLRAATQALPGLKAFRCDLTQDDDLVALVNQMRAEGGLSLLVNNAALQFNGAFGAGQDESVLLEILQEIDTNFSAPVKLTALCLPLLRASRESAVLNITSGLGFWPKKSAPVYCATKAGLHMFSQALRDQLAGDPRNPQIFEAVLPLVETDMTRGRGHPRFKLSAERVAADILSGLTRNRTEMHLGGVKALMVLQRLAPSLPARLLRNGL
ncbi:SDR family oxidoreductase [Deinococcus oregonensis]|uniref:SDR family oxidoreductase n=1 Tax=Deinococcus oregonensis TaxID=1805970 RepID=A0ABV6B331_9DEIO